MSALAVGEAALERRTRANEAFFSASSAGIAGLCRAAAERFGRGGRLVAVADDPVAWSDARHVAVEFVHPVIVGKRALPALACGVDALELLARPDDIVMAFGSTVSVKAARSRGCLTIAFCPSAGAEWTFVPPVEDAFVAQELVETLYHVVWELVHVFLDHQGVVEDRPAGPAGFLYPFLGGVDDDLASVVEDVRRSVEMKADEVGALRAQTLMEGRAALEAGARALRESFASGGTLLALGNGGSATDAMDVVADFRAGGWRALDLTEDPGILTAIANDIGVEAIFARQVIAYGRAGDVLLALSTSGGSGNVLAALAEARRRGLITIALVGYDGGRVVAEGLADHVVVTRSEHIPRIQEAQASAYHVLRELTARPSPAEPAARPSSAAAPAHASPAEPSARPSSAAAPAHPSSAEPAARPSSPEAPG